MVTGVETAGLVLGAIPLILAGLEFYAKGIAVTKRYWKYKREVGSLLDELGTESTMCLDSINMLLIGVVRQKEMADFLANPCGARWSDKEFETKLKNRLGPTYDSYIKTIRQMDGILAAFKQRLKLDLSGKPQFNEVNAFKEHYKRLRFSITKSDYKDLMQKLKHANLALYRMTNQTISIESLQNACAKTNRQVIPKYSIIHDRARGFYSALSSGWKCSCHAHHSVSLRLEPRIDDVSSDDDSDDEDGAMKDPFHILFRYSHHHSKMPSSTLAHPWMWEEADVRITIDDERAPPAQSCPRSSTKGVRFAAQAKSAVTAALNPQPNLQPIQDLCAAISTLQKPQRDVCLQLLATELAKQKYGLLIYPNKDPPLDPELWTVLPIRQVLQDSKFTRQDRLRLSVTLASSVLQLHETPWLEDWDKGNVFFVQRSGKTLYEHPFVSQHFNQVASVSKANTSPTSMSLIIRNETIYALGVFLIELWYKKPIHDLYKPEDEPVASGDACKDRMREFKTADRLADELNDEAGKNYSDAVRRCIRCTFDCRASSLEDVVFQRAVYQGVVAPVKATFDSLF